MTVIFRHQKIEGSPWQDRLTDAMMMAMLELPRFMEKGNVVVAQRHGFSYPNAAKRIISDLAAGCLPEHGLTDIGRDQIRLEVLRNIHRFPESRTVIVHSPLSRTEESAIVAGGLILPRERFALDDLRERYFGKRDGGPNTGYDDIWMLDAMDATHSMDGVEAAQAVRDRMVRTLMILHERFEDTVILLVGHGDPLQIAETAFRRIPVSQHRMGVAHWRNGEIRVLSALQGTTRQDAAAPMTVIRWMTTSVDAE